VRARLRLPERQAPRGSEIDVVDAPAQAVLGAASEFHVGSGGHDAQFWRSRQEDWLSFYSAA
jgi:hypothetical protein